MILLMVLQALLAILYFYTASFGITLALLVILFINMGALFKLGQTYWKAPDSFFSQIKILRVIFSVTLLALELMIFIAPDQLVAPPLQNFINDAEVFVTCILSGVLWQDKILKVFFPLYHLKKRISSSIKN